MSRPRHYSKLAEQKRQVPEQDDDSEQFDWQDVGTPPTDPDYEHSEAFLRRQDAQGLTE